MALYEEIKILRVKFASPEAGFLENNEHFYILIDYYSCFVYDDRGLNRGGET